MEGRWIITGGKGSKEEGRQVEKGRKFRKKERKSKDSLGAEGGPVSNPMSPNFDS